MLETASIILTVLAMVVVLIIGILPILPGPLMIWGVGLAFGIIDGFDRLHPLTFVFMTLFMVAGASSPLWLNYLGVRAGNTSIWGVLGAFIGAVICSITIPIPILGTVIGMIVGALLAEYLHHGDIPIAYRSGRSAIQTYLTGCAVDFTFSCLIFLTFLAGLWIAA